MGKRKKKKNKNDLDDICIYISSPFLDGPITSEIDYIKYLAIKAVYRALKERDNNEKE